MVGFQVTGQHCSSVVSIFMQESKRSVRDLCGRTDGNVKVVFPKEDVAVQPAESNTAQVNAGDYVLVKILSANSQSLRGRALSHSSLRSTVKHSETLPLHQLDEGKTSTLPPSLE